MSLHAINGSTFNLYAWRFSQTYYIGIVNENNMNKTNMNKTIYYDVARSKDGKHDVSTSHTHRTKKILTLIAK